MWLSAERKRHSHFKKVESGEIEFDDVEMDEERLLDIMTGEESCSAASRLDFDPFRMLGDADDQLDPIKARQLEELKAKRAMRTQLRRSKISSRPLTSLSSISTDD